MVTRDDYLRAERFLPENVAPLLLDGRVQPRWVGQADRFWYRIRRPDGVHFILVDPDRGTAEPAFDQVRLAAALSSASAAAYLHSDLPFDAIDFVDDGRAVRFVVEGVTWECDLRSYACARVEDAPAMTLHPFELPSPDGQWALFARDHNLFLRSTNDAEERRLTEDGEPWYAYGARPESRTAVMADALLERRAPPLAQWSPDGTRILTHRLDERQVGEMPLVQSILPAGGHRSIARSYRAALAGDEHIALAEMVVIDVASGAVTPVRYPPLPATYVPPLQLLRLWWSADGTRIYLVDEERDVRSVHFVEIDPTSGETRCLLTETSDTFVELGTVPYVRLNVALLRGGEELIWYSSRDGWGHLYRYDLSTGELINQVTSGAWVVHTLVGVDEGGGWVYFTAGGREEGRDPYFRHLYRVRLDGSDLMLLTPEDADHEVVPSPSGRFFLDVHGRMDTVLTSVLRAADGKLERELEQGDVDQLQALGWRFPEPFTVKARDGVTDLYGVIIRPTNFDSSKAYPVLDSIYPGPHTSRTPKSAFPAHPLQTLWHEQALAELGFIVIAVDGQGTPNRSKAFLTKAYGKNFGESGGLEDHIVALRQLAARDPAFDLDRVGIFGHSAGGYASVRAMLLFPDFFKVAVSGAGYHDAREYMHVWGDRYIGEAENYEYSSNYRLAANLRGKLLLAYGELDDNAPPAATLRLIDALTEANKDYDLMVLPHVDHIFRDFRNGRAAYEDPLGPPHPYFVRRRWDYFVQHLLGETPPAGFRIGDATASQAGS